MRRIDHLSPHYLASRLAVMWDERRHPDHPWLTREAVSLLDRLIRPDDTGLEFGSGRSTGWLLARLARLVSVEADPVWYERVTAANAGALAAGRLDYRLAAGADAYAAIVAAIPDASLGLCLIDGIHRDTCAVQVLPKLAPGALLVIDNVNRYVPCDASRSPDSRRAADAGATPLWDEFLTRVAGDRYLWTTNGVTDTGIWIRR